MATLFVIVSYCVSDIVATLVLGVQSVVERTRGEAFYLSIRLEVKTLLVDFLRKHFRVLDGRYHLVLLSQFHLAVPHVFFHYFTRLIQ